MVRKIDWWIRQAYLAIIPSYPIGYLIVHGFRGDQFWSKMYVERSSFQPSEHLKDLVESEIDKLGDLKSAKVRVSLTDYSEPFVYGGFFLQSGVELQLPMRLSFDDVEHARRIAQNVELDLGLARNRRKIEVNSKVGEELTSRMMLSEAAKMFVVQRELQIANSGVMFCAPLFAWFAIFGAGYGVIVGISNYAGIILGSILGVIVCVTLFQKFLSSFKAYKLKWADEKTVEIGEDYLQGARDYFVSTMKFNRLLRAVLGEDGEKNISKNGDVRFHSIPLSARLKNVNAHWKLKTSTPKDTSLSKFY